MKFFIPQAEDIEQSERVYSAIAEFIGATIQETSKRVYSITYKHNGKTMDFWFVALGMKLDDLLTTIK